MEATLNRWTYTAEVELQPNEEAVVGFNFGIANNPHGIAARFSTSGGWNHTLELVEDRSISNTYDPERGVHHHRDVGNTLPAWLLAKLQMQHDDIYLFHAPGSFTDGGGGHSLFKKRSSPLGVYSGEWLLTPGWNGQAATPRYYALVLKNEEGTAQKYTISIEYSFILPRERN